MNNADVILWTAKVARIFESDPRMPCLQKHAEHFLPKINCRHLLGSDFSFTCKLFVVDVALLKLTPISIVQVGNIVRAEEAPVFTILHALHEEIRNPVRRIEIVRATAVVARVAAKLQEIFHVVMPSLEVGAAGPSALATLVNGHELIVVELEKRNDALALAVCPLDVAASATNRCP